MENIETGRLLLRKFNKNDAEKCFVNFGQDRALGRYLPMYPVETVDKMEEIVCGFVNAYTFGAFIWLIEKKNTHEPIGYVTVDIPYPELGVGEIAYLLGKKYQGEGYALEAVQAVIDFMFQTSDLQLIEAKYNQNNIASAKLLERLHFIKECTLRDRRIDFFTKEKCNLIICSLKKDEFWGGI